MEIDKKRAALTPSVNQHGCIGKVINSTRKHSCFTSDLLHVTVKVQESFPAAGPHGSAHMHLAPCERELDPGTAQMCMTDSHASKY